MASKFVIYQDNHGWVGAAEYVVGRWPFKKVQHAPVTHRDSATQVFAWLLAHYPDRVICLDPAVSRRYREGRA